MPKGGSTRSNIGRKSIVPCLKKVLKSPLQRSYRGPKVLKLYPSPGTPVSIGPSENKPTPWSFEKLWG